MRLLAADVVEPGTVARQRRPLGRPGKRCVIELVQGEGGIYPLSADYVRKARVPEDLPEVIATACSTDVARR